MDIRKFIDKVKNFGSLNETYEQIGANSLMEAIKLNGFSINRNNDPNAKTTYFQSNVENELTEEIDFEFEDKGGIIVFSVEVNAVELSNNKLVRFIKNKIETTKNILFKSSKINKVIYNNPEIQGVTIGNFVKGRYVAKNGSLYDETSLSIEIIGISSDVLNKVAEELAKEFKQETVLVKNYDENKIYLVK
jgi:hypothetical protein